jgi:Flp pilus assembly pilin Flp
MFPRPRYVFLDDDCGQATVEYVLGMLAAAALAMILFAVVQSGTVAKGLSDMIDKALHFTG